MMVPDLSTAELITREEWDVLARRLCSFTYVRSKAETGGVYDLISEFDAAAAAIPPSHAAAPILPVLAGSLRRNAAFISTHPATTFQCFWNSCWWHDCRDGKEFAEAITTDPDVRMGGVGESGPVSQLMESWRSENAQDAGASEWVRSLLPPALPFAGRLRLELPVDTDTGRPVALRVSDEHVVAWFQHGAKRIEPRVWSRQTGEPIVNINRKDFPVVDRSLSPDGKLRVSFGGEGGGWGHPVRVSDTGTGDHIAAFPIDDDHNIWGAAFSPDGRSVAAGGYGIDYEGYVYVWDLQSQTLRTLVQLRSAVNSVAFSPSGDEILAGCSNGTLEVCKLATAAVRESIRANDAGIIRAAFSSDEKVIASISHDGKLRVWDLAGDPPGHTFAVHPDDVVEVKFSPSGDRLVTRSSNGTTWLWNGNTGKPIRCLYHSSMVVEMGGDSRGCLFVGNHMIVSVAHGGGVWTSSDGERLADVAERVYLGQSICFTSDGKRFALWHSHFDEDEEGVITVHAIRTRDLEDTAAETDVEDDDAEGEGGSFELSMTADGEFRTRRVPDRIALARFKAHAGRVTCCAFSAHNTLLVSGGADGLVKVWDWETATELFSARVAPAESRKGGHNAPWAQRPQPKGIQKVKFIDERTVAVLVGEAQIQEWDFRSGQALKEAQWTGTLDEYPRQMPLRADVRGDEVCITDTASGQDRAWFPCGRDLSSALQLVAHPNGRAWAGALGDRLFHFVLESH